MTSLVAAWVTDVSTESHRAGQGAMTRQNAGDPLRARRVAEKTLHTPMNAAGGGVAPDVVLRPLEDIVRDRSVWPRQDYDDEALARYRECVDQLPPVRVERTSRLLLDGFHRLKVFEELGRAAIPVVFEECPPHKHLARALELNRHGIPLPLAQRNAVIRRLAEQGLTQEDIAKAAGLTQQRVSQILVTSTRDSWVETDLRKALRLIEEGRSFREAGRRTGVPRSTVERALREAKARQELIRTHLQARNRLTSLLRYPDRGPWGKGSYVGNCTGYLLVDLLDYFKPRSVFDPMEGSGTTGAVCFDLQVEYVGRDLHGGCDLLSAPLPDRQFDLIFWHPPYWPGHRYSAHPNDFSNASTVEEYLERLRAGLLRLRSLLAADGHLVLLIGDGRKNGVFYPVHSEIIHWGLLPLDAVLIKEGDHERRARHFQYGPTPFIPTLHEYVLIFKGPSR